MSDDELHKMPCTRKLVFDTKAQAKAAANVAEYQYGTKLKVYVCRYCQLWHLASN